MAISDIPITNKPPMPPNLPPAYQAQWDAIAPQVEAEVRRNAQARGMGSSGEADIEVAQALTQLGSNLGAQAGAAAQGQAQQTQAEKARSDLATKEGALNAKAAGISGLMGGAGNIGGMYAAKKFGLLGPNTPAPTVVGENALRGSYQDILASHPGMDPVEAAKLAEKGTVPSAPSGGVGSLLTSTPGFLSGMPGASASSLGGTNLLGLPSAGMGAAYSPTALAGGALGGYLGNMAGARTFGAGTRGDIGGGIGGLLGTIGGTMLGGPLGGAAGAGLGSFLGHGLGESQPGHWIRGWFK